MSGEPPTPGSSGRSPLDPEDLPDAPPIHDEPLHTNAIPYPASFEDSIMHVVLNPPAPDSLRAHDAPPSLLTSLPRVDPRELPLPLHDPRRRFASDIPGIRLTHPGGRYEGGPAPEHAGEQATDRQYRAKLVHEFEIKSAEQLAAAVAAEKQSEVERLVQMMRSRAEVLREKEQVVRELQALEDQRGVELKAQRSIVEKQRARKAEKEERRAKRMRRAESG